METESIAKILTEGGVTIGILALAISAIVWLVRYIIKKGEEEAARNREQHEKNMEKMMVTLDKIAGVMDRIDARLDAIEKKVAA